MAAGPEQVLEMWQVARGSVLGPERRAQFLRRPELRDLAAFPPADLRKAFSRTHLLADALAWLREREQAAAHGRAPTAPAAPPAAKAALAASMRASPTAAEDRLWPRLRDGVLGHRAVRQWELRGWIVDFAVPDAELVIEVDGAVHAGRMTADRLRDDQLRAEHFAVLRFTNDDVERDLDRVVDTITSAVRDRVARPDLRREAAADLALAADTEKLEAARRELLEQRERERLARHSRQPSRPEPNPGIEYRCDVCDREFWSKLRPAPQCRRDATHPLRRRCREPECQAWIPLAAERCPRCADAREVAREAAGRGAKSQSQLRQAKRGKGWTGRE